MKAFGSFGAFAQHLSALGAVSAQNSLARALLEQSAQIIEKRAKEKIGDYQSSVGPFAAWASLAESTKEDRLRQGYPEDEPGLRSGAMRDSIQHKTTHAEAHVGSNNDHLVWFELGTSKQPPRSVLGGAAFEKAPEVVRLIGQGMTMHLEGKGVPKGGIPIK